MVKVLQLSVDVGKCHLPSVFLNRFQDFLLTVALSNPKNTQTNNSLHPPHTNSQKRASSISLIDCSYASTNYHQKPFIKYL